jgi:hypothetical protein
MSMWRRTSVGAVMAAVVASGGVQAEIRGGVDPDERSVLHDHVHGVLLDDFVRLGKLPG